MDYGISMMVLFLLVCIHAPIHAGLVDVRIQHGDRSMNSIHSNVSKRLELLLTCLILLLLDCYPYLSRPVTFLHLPFTSPYSFLHLRTKMAFLPQQHHANRHRLFGTRLSLLPRKRHFAAAKFRRYFQD